MQVLLAGMPSFAHHLLNVIIQREHIFNESGLVFSLYLFNHHSPCLLRPTFPQLLLCLLRLSLILK